MNAAGIKEYLGMCKNLEQEIYLQNVMISNINRDISYLGRSKQLPTPPDWHPDNYGVDLLIISVGVGGFIISAWLMSVIGWLLGFICTLGMIVSALIILWGLYETIQSAKLNEENKKATKYNEKVYDSMVEKDKRRIASELRQKAFLEAEIRRIQSANQKTKATLTTLYKKNIIHPNYRGLVPICSLYGYFDTGVCTQLEGHEGAYNKYDTESRLDRIIVKLDQVIQRLDEIQETQWVLYDSIQESNRKASQLIRNCEQMSNQLNGIQSQGAELNARIANLQTTSDINLYVNACAKRELEYMNRANRIF